MTAASPSHAERQRWARRYDDGEPWRAIAADVGRDESVVRRAAQPHTTTPRRRGPTRLDLDENVIVELHLRGWSGSEIAHEMGCSEQAVRLRLGEHGLCPPADQRPRKGSRGA